jgi:hypothetical protein
VTRQTPENRPPIYCSIDGMTMFDDVFTEQREDVHDPWTGVLIPRLTTPVKRCPTPGHDVWSLVIHTWFQTVEDRY